MAKKIKRKVSQVGVSPRMAGSAAVVEAPDEPVTAASSASFAPRTFNRKATMTTTEFNPDYTYVVKDLKRIGTLAGTFFVLLIALSFILPLIIK